MCTVDYHGQAGCSFLHKMAFQVMKKTFMFAMGILGLILVCSCNPKTEMEAKIAEVEKKYQDSFSIVRNELKEAKTKIIELLSSLYIKNRPFVATKDLHCCVYHNI